jgi:Txe/YoeB family toxin of Txe-Axe toxin-antitoxin module
MQIRPLRDDLEDYLKKHALEKKYKKAKKLFEHDPFYPSLNTELLEPKDRLIYSFRLDRKYRAILSMSKLTLSRSSPLQTITNSITERTT